MEGIKLAPKPSNAQHPVIRIMLEVGCTVITDLNTRSFDGVDDVGYGVVDILSADGEFGCELDTVTEHR